MDLKPIKTNSDYQMALSRLEERLDAPIGTPESDEADVLAGLYELAKQTACNILCSKT